MLVRYSHEEIEKKKAVSIKMMTETAKKKIRIIDPDCILVEITHYFLKIALRAAHLVINATLPHSNGTLNIVAGVVIGLDDDKHLL